MSFPPPGHFLTNLSAMASLMNMTPNQYQMTPMGGIMPMAVPGLQVPHMTTGISAPPGVTTISAPPMRKVTQDAPPLLGVSQLPLASPFIFPPLTSTSGVGVVTGVVNTGHINQSKSSSSLSHNNANSHSGNHKKSSSNGPSITVFVGNITERASDMLIRQLLSKCGAVNNWKRVQGANGKLQGFGFCEYSDPESAMKAIRLLHDFEVADKKLVVKADAKTQEKLDNYLKEKSPKGNDFGDSVQETEDRELFNQLHGILKEHEIELSRDPDPNKAQSRRYDKRTGESTKPENLADMDMEEEKRSLIHREIDKFRDTYKVDENEKKALDQDRNKDAKGNDSRGRDDRADRSDDRYSRGQSMEVDSENSRRERQRERTPLSKERSRNRDRYDRERHERNERSERNDRNDRNERNDRNSRIERNDRDRERERDRDRERERDRDRDRERERDRADENVHNERIVEDDEEMQERRRLERKLREKEASYQKRLRNWEAREMRKMKDYKKYEMKQEMRKEEEIKEVRKLKQFLEDYDDDRDDAKYYKGSALARRLREREKEKEEDTRDRRQEKRELEELRRKLTEEGHPDPESEAQKRLNSSDNNRERDKIVSNKMRELLDDAKLKAKKIEDENSLSGIIESTNRSEMHVKSFTFTGIKMGHGPKQPANPILNSPGENSNPGSNGEKRKKFSVQDVFNSNDDDDSSSRSKKRKLPQLMDDNTDSNQSVLSGTTKSVTSGITGENSIKTNLSTEEKKKQVKLLIEKIPTTKEDLFKYTIDWSLVDANLMEKRIRPWVNKKITEYIGEEEQALLDFICSKLQAKTSAQSILDDVAMVLDDEAEVFVVKMWRLLIYEIEAKKIGLGK